MDTPHTRKTLSPGTIVRMPDGFCCQITGPVISEGGGSIIYPVSRVRIDDGRVRRQEMEYALKECFPLSDRHRFGRREDGTVVAEGPDEGAGDFLAYVKKMQLAERDATSRIYHTAFRMVPIVESAEEVELSFDEGRTFHAVGNAMTVMESLANKGTALRTFLEDNRRGVPALVALRIVQQVLYALREVHDAGYLHLDIQDANVLLQGNLDDGSIQATLIDFGSARPLQDGALTAPIEDRALFSTRGFSAPEMARNDGTLRLGPQADLYSTGYLLLLLLTGTRYDPRSLADARGGQVLTPMRMRHTQCPAHLQASLQSLLQKALAQDPAARYATADEMLRDATALADALAPKQSDLAAVAYDAFICYKHNERDDRAAAALRHAIEHYRIPAEVRKASGKQRFDRVFLDTDELSSCANLGATIKGALVSASWLIVVCSPETPTSPWVAQEIDTFLEHHDASRILTVLTAGEPDEAFPERLRTASRDDMMFAADARATTVGDMEKTIRRDTVLRVAAPMLGVSYDALKQRRRAWQMRRAMAALGAVLAVALAFIGVMRHDNLRIQEEYEKAQIRESRYLAQESQRQLFEEDNRLEAVRTALQALPGEGRQRPYVAEAELALSQALRHYYPYDSMFYDTVFDAGGEVADVCISDDLEFLTVTGVVDNIVWVSTWNPHTGEQLWKKRLIDLAPSVLTVNTSLVTDSAPIVKCVPGAGALVVATYRGVAGVDAATGEVLWSRGVDAPTYSRDPFDGMIYDVQIPRVGDAAAETAYVFCVPEAVNGRMRIDAVNMADGSIKQSVDVDNGGMAWHEGYSNSLFRIAPSQDFALLAIANEDGDSACLNVSLEDGSIASSETLEGLPMDARAYEDEGLHEDWFVATYKAGSSDETPGAMRLARIGKTVQKGKAAGLSWLTKLPMSRAWTRESPLSRSRHSTFAHSYRETPLAFQFRQHVNDDDGGESGKLVLAADHDIYVVAEDSGKVSGHEVADSAVVGYRWDPIDGTDYPWLVYADGGIDPFFVARASSYNASMPDADGNPFYLYKLNDDLLLQVSANSSTTGQAVCAAVSLHDPTVVKTIGDVGDAGDALAIVEPDELHAFYDIALSARGEYLCAMERSYADAASIAGLTPSSADAAENILALFETRSWRKQARCKVDDDFDQLLGVTADGSHAIWQQKGRNESHNGIVWLTELATGTTEALAGLSEDDVHYAASARAAEGDAALTAVLSRDSGGSCVARLYRDGVCSVEMPLSLQMEYVQFDEAQDASPLLLSPAGTLAFRYVADSGAELTAFVDFANQAVFTMEDAVTNNAPLGSCLSWDGLRYASADSDGVVRIYNTHDGVLIGSHVPESGAVRGLSFIAGDSQLAVYTEDLALTIVDADSGGVVARIPGVRSSRYESYLATGIEGRDGISQDAEFYRSLESAYRSISLYETGSDLILQTGLREGCVIDRETMAVRGYVPNMLGYSASSDALIVEAGGNRMATYPVFSLEDLVAEGEALLSASSSSAI